MSRFIQVIDGKPQGLPSDRPINIAIPEREETARNPLTGDTFTVIRPGAFVGCAHWDDATLRAWGWYPVEGEARETQIETGYYLDGDVVRPQINDRPADELAAIRDRRKEEALSLIDQQAENARLVYITAGAGQALTYSRKLQEAKDLQANPEGDYPYLEAELGLTGDTLAEVAGEILAKDAAWTTVNASIEAKRLRLKSAVRAAGTVAAVAEIVEQIEW